MLSVTAENCCQLKASALRTLCVHTDSLPSEVGLEGTLGCGCVGQLVGEKAPVFSQMPVPSSNSSNQCHIQGLTRQFMFMTCALAIM